MEDIKMVRDMQWDFCMLSKPAFMAMLANLLDIVTIKRVTDDVVGRAYVYDYHRWELRVCRQRRLTGETSYAYLEWFFAREVSSE